MPALPDTISLDPVQGARPSTDVVAPTDFGLGQAGATFESVANMARRTQLLQIRAQAASDKEAVQPLLLKFENGMQDQFGSDAPKWNGMSPGFAADQIAKARQGANFMGADPALTPGQKAEFDMGANQKIAQFGSMAIEHEKAVIQQSGVDQNTVGENGALTGMMATFAPAKQALVDNYDGSQAGLATNTLAAFDQASAAARATVPPQNLPAFDAKVSAMRVEEAATTGALEQKGKDAFILKNGEAQASTLINTVTSNPSAYDQVTTVGIPAILATIPPGAAGLKKDLETELMGGAAKARVSGLIDQGNVTQAQTELNDGRYDAVLQPGVKEELIAKADAKARDKAPTSLGQAQDQLNIEQRAKAEITGILTTGKSSGLTAADLSILPYGRQAEILAGVADAQRAFAAAGPVREMTVPQLQALAHGAPPDPTDPDYANKLAIYQTQSEVAGQELATRGKDPGAWAWTSNGKGAPVKGPGAAAVSVGLDRGVALQQLWANAQAAPPGQARANAYAQYAGTMLGSQSAAGVPVQAREILPKDQVQALAASVTGAPPEGKLAALQSVAATLSALPATFKMPDGTWASPQAILRSQLLAAKLNPGELSAIVDFGNNPAALGRYVAATNNPMAVKPLPLAQERTLRLAVAADIAPELKATAPLPGAQVLNQARLDRTVLVARAMVAGGMDPTTAAFTASKDLTGNAGGTPYRYVDTWRMPASIANAPATAWNPNGGADAKPILTDTAGQVRAGAANVLSQLTANHGANLYVPTGQPAYSAAVAAHARWVPTPDDQGLALMTPKTDGTYQPVADRWGRAVVMGWDALKAQGGAGAPAAFKPPPPMAGATAVTPPGGGVLPGFSRQGAFTALAHSIDTQESHGVGGQISEAGALGRMQVLPATAGPYAQRLFGAPLDVGRLRNDDAYNMKIGRAVLADSVNHYGATPGGLVLSIADYFEGPGNIQGYNDKAGYHPGLIQKLGDPRTPGVSIDGWIKALPPKGRAYVESVLPRAVAYLATGQ